jgi:LysM domain
MADLLGTHPMTISLKDNRTAGRIAAVAAALLVGACSGGQSQMADKPNWSLADKRPVSLGGPVAQPKAEPAPGPVYEYRGGRDPVSGMARGDTPAGPRLIEIRKGDTLHGLSLTHHVSVKALMEANNLTSSNIVPGQKLVIPAS